MWPDRVSNPGPLTYVSGALPTVLCGPALYYESSPITVSKGIQKIALIIKWLASLGLHFSAYAIYEPLL